MQLYDGYKYNIYIYIYIYIHTKHRTENKGHGFYYVLSCNNVKHSVYQTFTLIRCIYFLIIAL